jgi:hypothetical protein
MRFPKTRGSATSSWFRISRAFDAEQVASRGNPARLVKVSARRSRNCAGQRRVPEVERIRSYREREILPAQSSVLHFSAKFREGGAPPIRFERTTLALGRGRVRGAWFSRGTAEVRPYGVKIRPLPAAVSPVHFRAIAVDELHRAAEVIGIEVGVPLRRREVGVPREELHRRRPRAVSEELRREKLEMSEGNAASTVRPGVAEIEPMLGIDLVPLQVEARCRCHQARGGRNERHDFGVPQLI